MNSQFVYVPSIFPFYLYNQVSDLNFFEKFLAENRTDESLPYLFHIIARLLDHFWGKDIIRWTNYSSFELSDLKLYLI